MGSIICLMKYMRFFSLTLSTKVYKKVVMNFQEINIIHSFEHGNKSGNLTRKDLLPFFEGTLA